MAAACQAAHSHNRGVTVHAMGEQPVLDALHAGVDGIEHGAVLTQEALRIMASRGVYYVPTASGITAVAEKERRSGSPALADMMEQLVVLPQRESIRKAMEAGILIGAGSDTLGSIPAELKLLHSCGMTPYEAIQTATVNAAKILKNQDRFGTVEVGKVADLLGMAIANGEPMVAVVRCNGSCAVRPKIAEYSGLRTCAAMNACGAGETACGFGCLGCGDCVAACQFDAIHMNPETGLPEVDEEKCTSCGACVKACPRHIIELRKKGPKGRRVFVSCVNKDKGPVAMKACKAACIGCGKCAKECPFGAITVENNVSYIDHTKCRLCRKCVAVCPTGSIHAVNFPAPKPKEEKEEQA
jgi:ferredoxin